jgi:hypothetical protein
MRRNDGLGATQTRHERAVATDLAVDKCLSEYTQPIAGAGGGDRGGGAGGDVWLEAVEKTILRNGTQMAPVISFIPGGGAPARSDPWL